MGGKTSALDHPWPNLTDHPKNEYSTPLLNPVFEFL